MKKQFYPDTTGGGTPELAKPVKTDYTPNADADFATVSKKVAASWAANPTITLVWMSQADFSVAVTAFDAAFVARNTQASNRPAQTFSLKDLDLQISTAVNDVKIYLKKKFKAAAGAQYARYGIVREGNNLRLPTDRDNRLVNLALMKDSIAADGFGAEEYGTAFWTATLTAYAAALKAAGNTDGAVSKSVGSKNVQKKDIAKVMKSLRLVLEGNYPDTYKSVLREWGWQKEDY